jgi:hypothetical protein
MNPARFNRIEPGTFDRQPVGKQTRFACRLRRPVVSTDPATPVSALVPTGIVPDDDQPRLPSARATANKPMINSPIGKLLGCPSLKYSSTASLSCRTAPKQASAWSLSARLGSRWTNRRSAPVSAQAWAGAGRSAKTSIHLPPSTTRLGAAVPAVSASRAAFLTV